MAFDILIAALTLNAQVIHTRDRGVPRTEVEMDATLKKKNYVVCAMLYMPSHVNVPGCAI